MPGPATESLRGGTAPLELRPGLPLPELDAVHWRKPLDAPGLRLRERVSAAYTVIYCTPLIAAGLVLIALQPLLAPVALVAWLHAWVIPELFAHRGARVALPLDHAGAGEAERIAQGFLADLLGHRERELQRRTGLALERGQLGVWLVGEAGALLVRSGGRRVHCFCARAIDPGLPRADRIAHLVLALRQDEIGFATVANHAFTGASWRVRRRLRPVQRPALAVARDEARSPERP